MSDENHYQLRMQVEVGLAGEPAPLPGTELVAASEDLRLEVVEGEGGHGFGLTELVEIAITIGATVTAEMIVDAIRGGFRGVVRRVRSSKGEASGDRKELIKLIQQEIDNELSNMDAAATGVSKGKVKKKKSAQNGS